MTTGRGGDPRSVEAGPNTTVERRVAHESVLGEADLLITHGGHGTVMAGARFGLPMLCLAPLADQPFNAAKVAELGVGVSLDPSAESGEIREAVLRLLADGALKERSRAFAAILEAEPGLEKAIVLVEALASQPRQ